jgi:carboxymethylenebutenolidase
MIEKIDQEIIELYDEYTHKPLPRRTFLEKLGKMVGGSAVALSVLPFLENNYAKAAIIEPSDNRIDTTYSTFKMLSKEIKYYRCVPKKDGTYPTIVLIHENRGLNPHIEDVARRLAVEGFLVIAPDALSLSGGTPKDTDMARTMIKALDSVDVLDLYRFAVSHAKEDKDSNKKVGCIGFCWGGGVANKLAAHCSKLDASVAYYGKQLDTKETQKIKIPLLLHYAGLDTRINAGITDFVIDLVESKVDFSLNHYKGVNHAFNNDTNEARYDKTAATQAWDRTVLFLKNKLN